MNEHDNDDDVVVVEALVDKAKEEIQRSAGPILRRISRTPQMDTKASLPTGDCNTRCE